MLQMLKQGLRELHASHGQGFLQAFTYFRSQIGSALGMATVEVKPFHYQDILKIETKQDVPWKKLTSIFISLKVCLEYV